MNRFKLIHNSIMFILVLVIANNILFVFRKLPHLSNKTPGFYASFTYISIVTVLLLTTMIFITIKNPKMFFLINLSGFVGSFGLYYVAVVESNSGLLGPFLFYNQYKFLFGFILVVWVVWFLIRKYYAAALEKAWY